MGSDLVQCIFFLQHASSQLKIWHWQTRRHGHHKALDFLVDRLRELIDRLAETTSGYLMNRQMRASAREGDASRVRIALKNPLSMTYVNLDPDSDKGAITQTQTYLSDLVEMVDGVNRNACSESESSISSILDDIVAVLQQGIYLSDLR